jgi:hypothetical protein
MLHYYFNNSIFSYTFSQFKIINSIFKDFKVFNETYFINKNYYNNILKKFQTSQNYLYSCNFRGFRYFKKL